MKINLTIEVDVENDILKVSGDSQGMYQMSDDSIGYVIRDAIKGNMSMEDRAIWKITDPYNYGILFDNQKQIMRDYIRKIKL